MVPAALELGVGLLPWSPLGGGVLTGSLTIGGAVSVTTGGSINIYMKKPAEEFGGFVEVGYGKYQQKTARATVNVPIIASGGLNNLDDVRSVCALEEDGVSGVITGRALYEGRFDVAEALGALEVHR